ncbi:MAG: hypothetical protein Q9197_002870 [Variospora fuerteventurae]
MARATRLYLTLIYLFISFIPAAVALYVPSLPATGDKDLWAVAVAKGTSLFQQLESGCYPDTINPIDREGLRAIGFRIGTNEQSQWPPIFQKRSVFTTGQMRQFNWAEKEPAYWKTSVERVYETSWTDMSRFNNEYSPLNGLITALEITKSPAETLQWSDIAFAMWEAVSSFSGQNPKDLRFIAQHSIRQPFTQSIIKQLFEVRAGEIRIFERDSDGLLALLGTPSGARAVYLLMQHKRQLGQKTIVRATVFGKTRSHWALHGPDVVFEVRDVVDAETSRAAPWDATSRERWAGLCQSLNRSESEPISQL